MKVIKLAFRSILSFRMYSGVNCLFMGLSLACAITIFRYVYGEFTVDRFNEMLERMYVTTAENNLIPGSVYISSTFPDMPVEEKAFLDFTAHPGVEKYAYFRKFDNNEIFLGDLKYNASILLADSAFLTIIDYPVISGFANLADPRSALITKIYAQKLFGAQNPVGKTFRFANQILTISGVIGQTSTKSTLSFDLIIPYHLYKFTPSGQTLVLLYPNVDYRTINKQNDSFFESPSSSSERVRYQLFPLSKLYFDKSINKKGVFRQGNFDYLMLLMSVGVLILLVGVISYINIYTAIILRRARELGVKKVFGAEGHNIFTQLMVENILITGLALLTAFLIAKPVNPFIEHVLHFDLISSIRFDLLLSFAVLLCIPLIATLYPFFRYQHTTVVNSFRSFDKIRSTGSSRHLFLSFQYTITIFMIIVSMFFIRQLQFMLNADPGYRTKDIIKVHFKMPPTGGGADRITGVQDTRSSEELQILEDRNAHLANVIVQKMNACPLFTFWTRGNSPNETGKNGKPFKLQEGDYMDIQLMPANKVWLELFDIPLKDGRIWDETMAGEVNGIFVIVTESVLKQYGITDYHNVVLQSDNSLTLHIIGVVEDFDYLDLSQKSIPVAFTNFVFNDNYYPIVASIVPGRTQDAIAFLRNLHDETVGGEFSFSFVEDEIREMYRENKKTASVFSIFTFIAIFISALGLLSMSLFDIQQRRKEIAIRKVSGATVTDIIRLLLKKYFRSLTISFIIAAPIALLAINRYLEGFAHKAPVSWWLFAFAVTLTAVISLITLVYQTLKAASQNPADVVKSE